MAAPGTDQALCAAAPWSDWEVASLCITDRLVDVVTKEGVTHRLLTEWRRARGAFCDAAVAGRPTTRQRIRLQTVEEKIRRAFAEASAESA